MFRSNLVTLGKLHSVKMRDLVTPTSAAAPVTIGRDIYLAGGATGDVKTAIVVQVYNMDSGDCRTLPPPPQFSSAAVAIDGNLVLIGGCDSLTDKPTNHVSTWMAAEERWTQALPLMNIKRNKPGAVLLNNHLYVFGGIGEDKKTYLDSIEALDLATCKLWMKSGWRLPEPLHSPQLGVFEDYIMLYGGFTSESPDKGSKECYKSVPKDGKMDWTRVHTAPSFKSALLTTSKDPVLIGGYSIPGPREVTGAIHRFYISSESDPENPKASSWQVIGELSEPRLLPTVAAVDDRSFLVLGGESSAHPMKSVERIIRS